VTWNARTSRTENPGWCPGPPVLLTLPERDPHCTCTWVPAEYSRGGSTRFALKYPDAACPAVRFHRRLEAAS
jgi:hypothetical protein